MEVWERMRERPPVSESIGSTPHKSIMFSRKTCYFFARLQKSFLEIWFFLGRRLNHPRVRSVVTTGKVKVGHQLRNTVTR
jgi:hypothetical protein